jgi:hypothetical protein
MVSVLRGLRVVQPLEVLSLLAYHEDAPWLARRCSSCPPSPVGDPRAMSAVGQAVLLLAGRKNISHTGYGTHLAVECFSNGIAFLQESDDPSGEQYR